VWLRTGDGGAHSIAPGSSAQRRPALAAAQTSAHHAWYASTAEWSALPDLDDLGELDRIVEEWCALEGTDRVAAPHPVAVRRPDGPARGPRPRGRRPAAHSPRWRSSWVTRRPR
jgi:hypothetical protein